MKIQEIKEIHVETGQSQRIDAYLGAFLEVSRSYIQKLIEQNLVQLNNKMAAKKNIINLGDIILVQVPVPIDLEVIPQKIELDMVFEDADLIVINKPRGLVVHPAAGHLDNTLVNALLHHCGDNLSDINGVLRPGIIHRIDKDTTGLLVVAKTQQAHINLSEQLKNHTMQREYLALVHGIIKENHLHIETNIGRSPKDRKKMAVVSDDLGKSAVTDVKVIKKFEKNRERFTYIHCKLETGRTHQIRVHLAHINHPIVGDKTYGFNKKIDQTLNGQLLHAFKIKFVHPTTEDELEFSKPIPADFQEILNKLEGHEI